MQFYWIFLLYFCAAILKELYYLILTNKIINYEMKQIIKKLIPTGKRVGNAFKSNITNGQYI